MTGAFVVMISAVGSMIAVFAVVLRLNRPEEGWRSWIREGLRGWPADDEPAAEDDAVAGIEAPMADSSVGLAALEEFDEPAGESAYVRPEMLLPRRRPRTAAPHRPAAAHDVAGGGRTTPGGVERPAA